MRGSFQSGFCRLSPGLNPQRINLQTNVHFQEQKPRPRQESRRPAQPRPFKGAPSNMQFFGPSDYVPELPHNVQVRDVASKCCSKISDQCLFRAELSDCRVEAGGLTMATESCLSLASSRDRPTSLTLGCRRSRSWSQNPGLIFIFASSHPK